MTPNILRGLTQIAGRSRTSSTSRRTRLSVRPLEERAVPTAYTVNSTGDAGSGSGTSGDLRYCITQLNSGGGSTNTIDATGVTGTITLGSALPTITKPVEINGPGRTALTISGGDNYTIIRIDLTTAGTAVGVTDLTISDGDAGNQPGGGVFNQDSVLTLTDCTVTSSEAGNGGGVFSYGDINLVECVISANTAQYGGGIQVSSSTCDLDVDMCTFSGNVATINGGGIRIVGVSSAVISNSTISGNTGSTFGGGFDIPSGGSPIIENSTISGNTCFTGAGIRFNGTSSNNYPALYNSTVTLNKAGGSTGGEGGGIFFAGTYKNFLLDSTIVAGNLLTGKGTDRDVYGSPLEYFSLIKEVTFTPVTGSSDNQNGQDPALGTLADNGGPTWTHAIDDKSPAFNTGRNSRSLVKDQTQTVLHNRVCGGQADIGAYEVYVSEGNGRPSGSSSPKATRLSSNAIRPPGALGLLVVADFGVRWQDIDDASETSKSVGLMWAADRVAAARADSEFLNWTTMRSD